MRLHRQGRDGRTVSLQTSVIRWRRRYALFVRRLGTSAAQLYRLLDQTNYRKSVDQVLNLLHVLDCDVDLIVPP